MEVHNTILTEVEERVEQIQKDIFAGVYNSIFNFILDSQVRYPCRIQNKICAGIYNSNFILDSQVRYPTIKHVQYRKKVKEYS